MKPQPTFKTLLLFVLLVAAGGISQQAMAQYQSFFGDSLTEYSIGTFVTSYDPYFFGRMSHSLTYYSNDTVVFDGKTYLRPHCDFEWNPDYYVREDTLMGRIYRYCTRTNTEYLICDMSLEKGDTFAFPFNPDYYGSGVPIGGIVDTVVYLNGRKNIIFRTDTASNNPCNGPLLLFFDNTADERIPIQFIEGIGSNYSPCGFIDEYSLQCEGGCFFKYLGAWTWDFRYPLLLCVHKDGELTYMADERAGCVQYGDVKVTENPKDGFALFPNPVRNRLSIRFESLPSNCILYISDMFGRIMFMENLTGMRTSINISHLQQGTYIATCIMDNKKYSRKFVKIR